MRLSIAEKKRRWEAEEAKKAERLAERRRARLRKLTAGAAVSFDADGGVCLTYPDGQVFKCRGPIVNSIFNHTPGKNETANND